MQRAGFLLLWESGSGEARTRNASAYARVELSEVQAPEDGVFFGIMRRKQSMRSYTGMVHRPPFASAQRKTAEISTARVSF